MSPENEKRARELARQLLAVAGDASERIVSEVRKALRDAPIERPKLKFDVQREGSTLKYRDKIFDMFADMNSRGIADDVQVAEVLKQYRGRGVNKTSLYELIDGSSDCKYPRNKARLLAYLKRTENT
jgi:hypothetical protein